MGWNALFLAQFFKFRPNHLRKIRPITFIVWVLRRVEKMAKKGKNANYYFFVSWCGTYFSIHFSKAFKKYNFRSVVLITKMLWTILDFFTRTGLFTILYPSLWIKKNHQNFFKFLSIECQKITSPLKTLSRFPPPPLSPVPDIFSKTAYTLSTS